MPGKNLPRPLRGKKCGGVIKPRAAQTWSGKPIKPSATGFCTQAAGYKTDHPGWGRCKFHGGCSTSGKIAAAKERAAHDVVTFGFPIDTDPIEALLDGFATYCGIVQYLTNEVRRLEHEDLKQHTYDKEGRRWERPAVWVDMLDTWTAKRDRLGIELIKCGLEQRKQEIEMAEGMMIATVIKAVLTEVGVVNMPEVPALVGKHLRAIGASVKP